MKRIVLILCLMMVPVQAFALGKEAMEKKLGVIIKSVEKSPIPGLSEVVTKGSEVFYIDKSGRYLFDGIIFDLKKNENLTQKTIDEAMRVDFSTIPLKNGIKIGSGLKKLVVFHDPDCPYCRKLYNELKKLKDVEVYNFLFGLPNHPEAYGKAQKVYCADDPAKALDDVMTGKSLTGLKTCETDIVDQNKKLSGELGVRGTPHMIMENGLPISGFKSAEVIQKKLESVK